MSNVSIINGHIDEPKGLTDEQIIKALEQCASNGVWACRHCPFFGDIYCKVKMARTALELINRLKADKEALIKGQESLMKHLERKKEIITELDNEVERLKGDLAFREKQLDNLANEMTEGKSNDKAFWEDTN